ncbi:MAG: ComEC/Rec2 family competence protein, partial [Terriglobales bacterium]
MREGWKRNPSLAVLALAWVGGGTLALIGSTLIPLWVLAAATGLALLGALRLRPLLIVAVLLAGGLWTTHAARHGLAARLPHALEGQTLTVVGRVAKLPRNEPQRARFTLRVDSAHTAQGTQIPSLRRIGLSWYRPPAVTPRVGERWQLQVRLKRPRSLSDPGSFDYAGWAFAHGVDATGYVYHNHAVRLAPAGAGLGPLRARIARAVHQALPDSPWAGLVAGLAVGARGGITQAQWRTLRATGTSH